MTPENDSRATRESWLDTYFKERQLRPDGYLSAFMLKAALRYVYEMKCSVPYASSLLRTDPSAVARSVTRARRRGLFDWQSVAALSLQELDEIAYGPKSRRST